MSSEIDRLLSERQRTMLRERRAADRQPFTRPVHVQTQRGSNLAFSRDMSRDGIALISQASWPTGTMATLRVHSLFSHDAEIRAEARWSEPYGKDWHITGWRFINNDD